MPRLLFFLGLFLLFSNAFSQSNTDEMLGAPRAKDFIQLRADFDKKKFYYIIDGDDPSSRYKTLKNLTVGVPMRRKEVALTIQFYNPLRYSIRTSDIMLEDPSYQSIGQFAALLTNLLGNLPNAAPIPTPPAPDAAKTGATTGTDAKNNVNDPGPLTIVAAGAFDSTTVMRTNNENVTAKFKGKAKDSLTVTPKESSGWAKKINGLRGEELAEWKLVSVQGNVKCIDVNSKALAYLQQLDDRYFNASIRGEMKKYLIELSKPDNITEFKEVNKRFKKALDSLDKVNQENIRVLQTFNDLVSGDLTKDLLRANAITATDYSCESFVSYSQIVFKRFARARAEFQQKRNQMLALGHKISEEVDHLMTTVVLPASDSQTSHNAFILNRYDIQLEKMRDVRIAVQERALNFNATPPSIDKTDNSFEGSLRLRAAQTFVPEFSLGGFYTDIAFPVHSAESVNDTLRIARTTDDYHVGVAGMLNLTLNALDGLAHPLIQLGVGTGKDRPTILTGGGLRLSWRQPIIITGGPIWHWEQRLQNGLVEGDRIENEETLKRNLQYRFVPQPDFYLGVQIGF